LLGEGRFSTARMAFQQQQEGCRLIALVFGAHLPGFV